MIPIVVNGKQVSGGGGGYESCILTHIESVDRKEGLSDGVLKYGQFLIDPTLNVY